MNDKSMGTNPLTKRNDTATLIGRSLGSTGGQWGIRDEAQNWVDRSDVDLSLHCWTQKGRGWFLFHRWTVVGTCHAGEGGDGGVERGEVADVAMTLHCHSLRP